MASVRSASVDRELELAHFMESLRPLVDDTIEKLGQTKFREDPIGGRKYSRATSIISSSYKRHGQILGEALLEKLKECSRYQVWREDAFRLSSKSLQELREHEVLEKCLTIKLPYGETEKTIPVDVIVFDKEARTLRSYNVKRGNGSYDAGKRRIITGELLRTNMLLLDYGRSMGVDSSKAEARIIFYYGLRSVAEPLSLVGEDLNEHFRFPVLEAVEAINEYFREKLYQLIETE
jgi:hypothetical protein